jgi:hypothetical protein
MTQAPSRPRRGAVDRCRGRSRRAGRASVPSPWPCIADTTAARPSASCVASSPPGSRSRARTVIWRAPSQTSWRPLSRARRDLVAIEEHVLDVRAVRHRQRTHYVRDPFEAGARTRQATVLEGARFRFPRRPELHVVGHGPRRPRQPSVPDHPGPQAHRVHHLPLGRAATGPGSPVQRSLDRHRARERVVRRRAPADPVVAHAPDDDGRHVEVEGREDRPMRRAPPGRPPPTPPPPPARHRRPSRPRCAPPSAGHPPPHVQTNLALELDPTVPGQIRLKPDPTYFHDCGPAKGGVPMGRLS